MTKKQYEILSATHKAYISAHEIMILYECKLATAKKIKKNLIKKIQEEHPKDLARLPAGNRLPVFFLLRKQYLPFSVDDLKTYRDIIDCEMEESRAIIEKSDNVV